MVEFSGQQFLVTAGEQLEVDRLSLEEGEDFLLTPLLVSMGKNLVIGMPEVEDVSVKMRVLEHKKGEKISVRRFRSKSRYRRNKGHRQPLSVVEVEEITGEFGEERAEEVEEGSVGEEDVLAKLSTRTRNILKEEGVSLQDLAGMSRDDLLEIEGIGESRAEEIIGVI